MSNADDMFAAAHEIAKVVIAQRQAERAAQRDARNARRRARYARTPKQPRVKTPAVVEPEYEEPDSCYCHATPMPPCAWCTNGGGEE